MEPMSELVQEKLGDEEACPYLPGERSMMRYRVMGRCRAGTYQRMLERGWRRFGRAFFRPVCQACAECRSLRVHVPSFRPNRSMRRNLKRNEDVEVFLGRPGMSMERFEIYRRYHRAMVGLRDWPVRDFSAEDYYYTFVDGEHEFGYELTFVLSGRLVGVSLLDLLPEAVSAVYCYYDPELRSRGLGVLSVLKELEVASAYGIPWLYLGFWVEGNRSMRYKAGYRPHQVLAGRPADGDEPVWVPDGELSSSVVP